MVSTQGYCKREFLYAIFVVSTDTNARTYVAVFFQFLSGFSCR